MFSEQGATLTIDSARLINNGQYACTPFNVAGDGGTSTIIIEVQGMEKGQEIYKKKLNKANLFKLLFCSLIF